jgi:hypothetical protein
VLVLVNLPLQQHSQDSREDQAWRSALHKFARREQVIYFDLTEELWRLDQSSVPRLYISANQNSIPTVPGHFSGEGNLFVAKALLRRLLDLPQVQRKLAAAGRFRADTTPTEIDLSW